jgi:hypothetical protein
MVNNRIMMLLVVFLIVFGAQMVSVAASKTVEDFQIIANDITSSQFVAKSRELTLSINNTKIDTIVKIEIVGLPAGMVSAIDGAPGTSKSGNWTSPQTWIIRITNNEDESNGDVHVITYRATYANGEQKECQSVIQLGFVNDQKLFSYFVVALLTLLGFSVGLFANKLSW